MFSNFVKKFLDLNDGYFLLFVIKHKIFGKIYWTTNYSRQEQRMKITIMVYVLPVYLPKETQTPHGKKKKSVKGSNLQPNLL